MLFNSFELIFIFLPIVVFSYYLLNIYVSYQFTKLFLLFSNLFFYSYWNINFLPLLLFSIFINYTLNILFDIYIFKKKLILFIGIVFNILLLAYFKYFNFFLENINDIFDTNTRIIFIVLPLGISFFTLQQIAFLCDKYNSCVKKTNFLDYSLFVSFFPQLIAGPIVHHKELISQFTKKRALLNSKDIASFLFMFSIGLFKKVVIADTFALYANNAYSNIENLTFISSWIASLAYTFQLYFDFSGYSDMAIALALLFKISLPINFNSPYQSRNIIEFWKNWHITLSAFINVYIFSSILKSIKSKKFHHIMYVSFVTMLIVGFWHGANWTFIFFGAIHGIALIINHILRKNKIQINKTLAWFMTFFFINLSLVFFRSDSILNAFEFLFIMFDLSNFNLDYTYKIYFNNIIEIIFEKNIYALIFPLFFLSIGFMIIFNKKNSNQRLEYFQTNSIKFKDLFFCIFIFSISLIILLSSNGNEFLYFNF